MATLGHVAIGMAAGRVHAGRLHAGTALPRGRVAATMVVLSLLSMAADLDVLAFALGIPYAAPWGHRGAVHSVAFAILVGVIVGIAARLLRLRSPVFTGIVAGVVFTSHGILDTFTDGGLGMALLWPFSNQRFFAPWQPIPVAPIGPRFFSAWGLHVTLVEAVYFFPLFVFAFWPRRQNRSSTAVTLAEDDSDPDVVDLPIDGVLDLHTFSPKEVKRLLPDYLAECRARGISEVRIVHGKGTGTLRRTVHAVLGRLPEVDDFISAGSDAGGWGATLVVLKPSPRQ